LNSKEFGRDHPEGRMNEISRVSFHQKMILTKALNMAMNLQVT